MKITFARRISQIFFLLLFLWLCLAATPGVAWWQLRGWPVNWFIQLDPLAGLGVLMATGTLFAGLIWGVVTAALTLILGRFFCGFLCPLGTLQQAAGYIAHRREKLRRKIDLNRYRPAQKIKYGILVFLLFAAAGRLAGVSPAAGAVLVTVSGFVLWSVLGEAALRSRLLALGSALLLWGAAAFLLKGGEQGAATLQIGLLDPIVLSYRFFNLVLLPILDRRTFWLAAAPRYYEGAALIAAVFLAAVLTSLILPRFFCRFVCPLGAFFGILGRMSLFRIGRKEKGCVNCAACARNCEGGCEPDRAIKVGECVLCFNCLHTCLGDRMGYDAFPAPEGGHPAPDLSRRAAILALASGAAAVPVLRLSGGMGPGWAPGLIRPPGSLAEADFLSRCLKCGQCMRVCPTNTIQPAALRFGLEALWTPVLDFRRGTSGCQYNCIACGNVCPTAAIRLFTLAEKQGRGGFAARGPIRLGTAFVDQGRCLPWTMGRPCIVCQENCPVSPKAIAVQEIFSRVSPGPLNVTGVTGDTVALTGEPLEPGRFASGDYYAEADQVSHDRRLQILYNGKNHLVLAAAPDGLPAGAKLWISVRLQRPAVDPDRCIGCGVCEHECPVRGRPAIRVSAENESRERRHAFVLG